MDSEILIGHLVNTPNLKKVHYIADFISEEEEQYLLRQVACPLGFI